LLAIVIRVWSQNRAQLRSVTGPINMHPANYQWNELSPLLTEYNIPLRHALAAGIVSVRIAMGATASDLPPGYARPLEELQQHIRQQMQDHLRLLGVPGLYTMCCEQNLWTPRQLQVRLRDGELDISQLQLCCMRLHRIIIKNNLSVSVSVSV